MSATMTVPIRIQCWNTNRNSLNIPTAFHQPPFDILIVTEPWWGPLPNGSYASTKPSSGFTTILPCQSVPVDHRPRGGGILCLYTATSYKIELRRGPVTTRLLEDDEERCNAQVMRLGSETGKGATLENQKTGVCGRGVKGKRKMAKTHST